MHRIPAKDLGKIYFLRDSAMASRIQRFWRRLCGGVHFDKPTRERGARKGSLQPERGERGKEWVASESKKTITAPEIKWLRRYVDIRTAKNYIVLPWYHAFQLCGY